MEDYAPNMALLIMDVQELTIARVKDHEAYLKRLRGAVSVAHKNSVRVIYIVLGFRPGFPEVSSNNKSFSAMREMMANTMLEPRPLIEPTGDDVVVLKRRVSAFTGSDLEVVLRSGEINHLILAGLSTSGVVLSTTREAADKDYRISILSDLCADSDEEVHTMLMTKLFPRQATVLSSEDWEESLSGRQS